MAAALVTRTTFGRPKGQEPKAKRHCSECGAGLYSGNRLTICGPCNGGTWDPKPTELQERRLMKGMVEGLEVAA